MLKIEFIRIERRCGVKAFLVGLLFLAALGVFIGMWVLFFPLLLVTGLLLRVCMLFILGIGAIWLLGKFIIFIWGKLKS